MRNRRLFQAILLGLSLVCAASASATNWLQFGYDQTSSSDNTAEPGYSTAGNKLAYSVTIPSSSDSTPIYLSTENLLFIVARNGTLLALNAANGTTAWSHPCVPPKSGFNYCTKLTTGAPAIDPGLQYVYAYGLDGNVHKYPVDGGTEITTGGWPELSTLKPDAEKGASGLSIATSGGVNYLYSVTNGYDGDGGDYQGHITTINLGTGAQYVFNTQCSNLLNIHFVENGTPQSNDCNLGTSTNPGGPSGRDGQESGIWGRPGAVYDAVTNQIYIATGNGLFNANTSGGYEWGDSVLRLNVDGTGSGGGMPVDSYTPVTYVSLDRYDTDVGSTAPAILPSTSTTYPHLAIQSGKDSCVRLINLDQMGSASGPGNVGTTGSELNAATSCSTDAVSGQVRTQPAVWVNPADGTTWFFIAADGGFYGYQLSITGTSVPTLKQPLSSALSSLPGGTSPVVANGTLYYVANNCSSCTVYAVNATTGAVIWSDSSPQNIHWESPIVVNGRLYLVDGNSTLWVYQLDGIFKNGFGVAANGYK